MFPEPVPELDDVLEGRVACFPGFPGHGATLNRVGMCRQNHREARAGHGRSIPETNLPNAQPEQDRIEAFHGCFDYLGGSG